jgi:hypothetical protein
MRLEAFFTKEDLIRLAIEDLKARGFSPVKGAVPLFAPYKKTGTVSEGDGQEVKEDSPILAITVSPVAPSLATPPLPLLLEEVKSKVKEAAPEPGQGYVPPQVEQKEDKRKTYWDRLSPKEREQRSNALKEGKRKAKEAREGRGESSAIGQEETVTPSIPAPVPVVETIQNDSPFSNPFPEYGPFNEHKRPEVVAPSIIPFPEPVSAS